MNGKSTHFAMAFTRVFHAYHQMTICLPWDCDWKLGSFYLLVLQGAVVDFVSWGKSVKGKRFHVRSKRFLDFFWCLDMYIEGVIGQVAIVTLFFCIKFQYLNVVKPCIFLAWLSVTIRSWLWGVCKTERRRRKAKVEESFEAIFPRCFWGTRC